MVIVGHLYTIDPNLDITHVNSKMIIDYQSLATNLTTLQMFKITYSSSSNDGIVEG